MTLWATLMIWVCIWASNGSMPQLNSSARNGAASYSKSRGTVPQNFHGQIFHLACCVWRSVPTKKQCMWNSSPWQVWNAMRYWTRISKNEKGGHSDTSQGNPRGCSLERQVACVHSDKHARSRCWRKFHPRIWPGYNAYMRFVDKSDRMVKSYGIARRTW